MNSVKTSATGLTRYRGQEGQLSFILHRLTGLGTLLFLAIHILDTSTVYFFPSLYEHAIAIYRHPLFMLGEIALVFAVIYHGVNGLRIAFFDLAATRLWKIEPEKISAGVVLLVSVVLWLPAAFLMFRSLVEHSL